MYTIAYSNNALKVPKYGPEKTPYSDTFHAMQMQSPSLHNNKKFW